MYTCVHPLLMAKAGGGGGGLDFIKRMNTNLSVHLMMAVLPNHGLGQLVSG